MATLATTAPARDLEQRLDALAKGNAVRTHRAKVKRDLKARRTGVTDVLTRRHPLEETWKVYGLLLAAPKYGRVKANKALHRARISPSKTVGGLSDRQRRELVALLSR